MLVSKQITDVCNLLKISFLLGQSSCTVHVSTLITGLDGFLLGQSSCTVHVSTLITGLDGFLLILVKTHVLYMDGLNFY